MALLRHHEAYRQWSTLLEAVEQMVDWVHFTATVDTFNSVLAPKLVETIACFSACVDPDTGVNLGAELDQFLRERHRWSGAQFDVHVNAVDLLSSLKSFRVVSEKPLGKGAYSRVMLARSLLTGETIVHKHVQLESAEHGMPLHVLRELALLKKMSHPHVVRCAPATFERLVSARRFDSPDGSRRTRAATVPRSPTAMRFISPAVFACARRAAGRGCGRSFAACPAQPSHEPHAAHMRPPASLRAGRRCAPQRREVSVLAARSGTALRLRDPHAAHAPTWLRVQAL